MNMLIIRCPKTGRAISTGREVEIAAFRSTPVFFSRTYCPLCHVTHEWFAQDAWVCNLKLPNATPRVSNKLRSAQQSPRRPLPLATSTRTVIIEPAATSVSRSSFRAASLGRVRAK